VTFRVEPLGDQHLLDSFDCGNPELNQWLQVQARHATAQGTRTYVLIDKAGGQIAGYFALAPHLLGRQEVPTRVGRGAPRHIPAILLAKLALDRNLHGQGLGAELLVRALRTTLAAARGAGGKIVVVDAVDGDAERFYEHHDFVLLPGNPRRLVRKLSTIAKALREPWP
jgi:GNAT superfamily N-acetyltransferase